VTMPSEEKYRRLIAELRKATDGMNAADTEDEDGRRARLTAGFTALQEVIVYLSGDPDVRAGGLTRPLGLIENALRDASRGGAPVLLDLRPEGPGLKPSGTTREDVQGGVAAAVEILKRGGWGTGRAAEEIAAKTRKAQLCCADGAPISKGQVATWRSEITKGKAAAAARVAFEVFCQYERLKSWWMLPRTDPRKREAAENAAEQIIATLANITPRVAPKRTTRAKS